MVCRWLPRFKGLIADGVELVTFYGLAFFECSYSSSLQTLLRQEPHETLVYWVWLWQHWGGVAMVTPLHRHAMKNPRALKGIINSHNTNTRGCSKVHLKSTFKHSVLFSRIFDWNLFQRLSVVKQFYKALHLECSWVLKFRY